MRRFASISLIILVFSAAGCSSRFDVIRVGMPADEVVALLGEPDVMDSTNRHWSYTDGGEHLSITFSREMPRGGAGVVETFAIGRD